MGVYVNYQKNSPDVIQWPFAIAGQGQMPRILKDLTITEVSSVDRGAGEGVKVLLMKRNTPDGDTEMTKEELAELIKKSAEEAVKTATATFAVELAKRDKEITVLKMSPAHKAFYDDMKDEDSKKAFEAKDEKARDEECAKVAKAAESDPAITEVAKRADALAAENVSLKKRLDEIDLEKAQADFKKRAAALGLTQDGDGEIMRKAYSGDKEAQASFEKRQGEVTAALRKQADTGALFDTFGKSGGNAANGNAYQSLVAKADEVRKTDSKLTAQQAFTKVYTDPANAELKKQYLSEEARGEVRVVA